MYAVIFKAEINSLDENYFKTIATLRKLAFEHYGCIDLISVTQDNREISISYWENEDKIKLWKQNLEHLAAQELGRSKWYKSYSIQVVRLVREYSKNS